MLGWLATALEETIKSGVSSVTPSHEEHQRPKTVQSVAVPPHLFLPCTFYAISLRYVIDRTLPEVSIFPGNNGSQFIDYVRREDAMQQLSKVFHYSLFLVCCGVAGMLFVVMVQPASSGQFLKAALYFSVPPNAAAGTPLAFFSAWIAMCLCALGLSGITWTVFRKPARQRPSAMANYDRSEQGEDNWMFI